MNDYVSIKVILDKILRHPMLQDLSLDAAIDYTVDFIRIVGMPKMFPERHITVDIDNYRGVLPDDIYQIIHIFNKDSKLSLVDDVTMIKEDVNENNSFNSSSIDNHVYKIQNRVIYTSIKKGTLDVYYKALQTDEQGFPMIIDNSSFTRALELYIKKQWFTILFDMGKIQGPVLQNVQKEYAWAVGDCQSEFNRMNLDQAEYFYKSMKSSIVDNKHAEYGFKYLGR